MSRAILIVEDSIEDREIIKEYLLKTNFSNLVFATNYKSAIEKLNTQNFDAVLIDINLNDNKDGILLAATIDLEYNLPYIFVTGYHKKNSAIYKSIAELKYQNYVPKPISEETLITNLNVAISGFKDFIKIAQNAEFNIRTHEIKVNNKTFQIPPKPTRLLTILAQNINKFVDRGTIFNYVWANKQPNAGSSLRELKRNLINTLNNSGIEINIDTDQIKGLKLTF